MTDTPQPWDGIQRTRHNCEEKVWNNFQHRFCGRQHVLDVFGSALNVHSDKESFNATTEYRVCYTLSYKLGLFIDEENNNDEVEDVAYSGNDRKEYRGHNRKLVDDILSLKKYLNLHKLYEDLTTHNKEKGMRCLQKESLQVVSMCLRWISMVV